MSEPDVNARATSMQLSIGGSMSPSKVSENDRSLDPSRFKKRRPFPIDVSLHHVVCGFIDGKPVLHFGSQMPDCVSGITGEEPCAVASWMEAF